MNHEQTGNHLKGEEDIVIYPRDANRSFDTLDREDNEDLVGRYHPKKDRIQLAVFPDS